LPDELDEPTEPTTRLSAEETEAIAKMLRSGVPERGAGIVGPSVRGTHEPIVLRYDLVGGMSRGLDDLPGLQLIHERFAQELATEFRRTLGQEGHLTAERIQYARFAEVYAQLGAPTALVIANFIGVGCTVFLEMEPALMLHLLDLLMGGQGGRVRLRGDFATRGFTPTEQGLISHLTGILSRSLRAAWSEVTPVALEPVRVATDPRHAALYSPGETMADLRVRVEWGDVSGRVRLVAPLAHLNQFGDKLSRTATPNHMKAESLEVEAMRRNLAPVEITVRAILGATEMTVEALLGLSPGDVLRLDSDPDEALTIYVEEEAKLRGFPTVQRGNVAVTITDFVGLDEGRHSEEMEDDR